MFANLLVDGWAEGWMSRKFVQALAGTPSLLTQVSDWTGGRVLVQEPWWV